MDTLWFMKHLLLLVLSTMALADTPPIKNIFKLSGRGGTGAIISNGSTISAVAPGTNGNVLTSNGTTWVSAPSSGGGGGGVAPTVQRFTSGSGNYTRPTGPTPLYIVVEMCGGGGGGGGAGSGNSGSPGGNGGDTTFGALDAGGGVGGGGAGTVNGGAGGTVTTGLGQVIAAVVGGSGGDGSANAILNGAGGGGSSPFGGAGGFAIGQGAGYPAHDAAPNSCSGGSGIGFVTYNSSAGGGAGGYIKVLISNPVSTYAYAVGAGGTAGAAGSGGLIGGAGGSGVIIVTEYYQ